jgi:ppGpp synthetase/RelA/SpoT-type nucleotidyltranferase
MLNCADHSSLARTAYERAGYQAYLQAVCARTRELVQDALHGPLTPEEASVTARVKAPESFQLKAAKPRRSAPKYLRPLSGIHDQVAVRVVVLHTGYLTLARDLIQAIPEVVVEAHEDKAEVHAENRSFGYRGIHLSIRPVVVEPACPDHECGALERVEIQVRTQAQHAWAEVEHRLRYKNEDVDEFTSRTLDRAAALLETADDMLSRLVEAAEMREREALLEPDAWWEPEPEEEPVEDVPVEDVPVERLIEEAPLTLSELLERRFPGARQPTRSSLRWMRRCAATLGFSHAGEIDEALEAVPFEAIERVFRAVGHSPRSQLRQLDDGLLWIGRERYVEAAERGVEGTWDRYARGRPGILRWRLERLRDDGVLPPPADVP